MRYKCIECKHMFEHPIVPDEYIKEFDEIKDLEYDFGRCPCCGSDQWDLVEYIEQYEKEGGTM